MFNLESDPGASKTIYLNFRGADLSGTDWIPSGSSWNGVAPAFTFDGDSTSFSSSELAAIKEIFARVACDYAPFKVNVTTKTPSADRISRSSLSDTVYGTVCLFSNISAETGYSGFGGVASVGVFGEVASEASKPALVFPSQLGANPKSIAEAGSHEIGHNLGLSHDGTSDSGYYSGQGSSPGWAPIMGVGYYKTLVQFSRGTYAGANNQENDFSLIAGQGVDYWADVVGNDPATAVSLAFTDANGDGVSDKIKVGGAIELTAGDGLAAPDRDFYGFLAPADGSVTINIRNALSFFDPALSQSSFAPVPAGYGNLRLDARLQDANGTILVDWSDHASLDVSNLVVPGLLAGRKYYLSVFPNGSSPDGEDTYGSLGDYVLDLVYRDRAVLLPTISVSFAQPAVAEDSGSALLLTFTRTGPTDAPLTVSFNVSGIAGAPTDYSGLAAGAGTVDFAEGSSSVSFQLKPKADHLVEADETIVVTLAGGSSYTVADSAGVTGTITNDDLPPNVTLSSIGGADGVVSAQKGDNSVVGRAEPGRSVAVYSNGTRLGAVTADAGGGFSYALTASNLTAIGQGSGKSISAMQSDAYGNQGVSLPFAFAVDSVAPSVSIAGIGGVDRGVSSQGGDNSVEGRAEARGLVSILYQGVTLGMTSADESGTFSYSLSGENIAAIGQGSGKEITASQSDAAGNVGISASFSFTVDTVAPAVSITGIGGSDMVVSAQKGDNSVVGRAEPGRSVAVYSNGTRLGAVTADAGGGFSYALTASNLTAIGQGSGKSISAMQSDAYGNQGVSLSFSFAVDCVAPSVSIAGVGGVDRVVSSQSGDNSVEGQAEAHGLVSILYQGVTLGTTSADESGTFSYSLSRENIAAIGQGSGKEITASQSDAAGNVGTSTSFAFTVDTVAPAVSITGIGGSDMVVSAQNGHNAVVGMAEADRLVSIQANGAILGTTLADAVGAFSYRLSAADLAAIGEGSGKEITAGQSDAAGNMGTTSPFVFTVDTFAPAVSITSIGGVDHFVSTKIGDSAVNGLAEAGRQVSILYQGVPLGTVLADGNGAFSYGLSDSDLARLDQGTALSITAVQVDAGGNAGTSQLFNFSVQKVPPTYSLSAPASVMEGQSFALSLTTTRVADGTALPWRLSGLGVTPSDLDPAALNGSVVVNRGTASLSLLVAADNALEATETAQFELLNAAGAVVARRAISLLDTNTVWGTSANDVITGAPDRTERITGVPALGTTPAALGTGQRDVVTGGVGADEFVLSQVRSGAFKVFYNDNMNTNTGLSDYLQILDFNLAEDKLRFARGRYFSRANGGDTWIWYDRNNNGLLNTTASQRSSDELVAVLTGVTLDSATLSSRSVPPWVVFG